MKVIVGLGNPGGEYEDTRHNAGFMLVDRLSRDYSVKLKKGGKGLWGEGRIAGEEVTPVKPITYMNRSGLAVAELLQNPPPPPE